MIKAKNPILPGFCPDPSICRVENDYYIVTSSFAYFPGIPVYHSRDLVNWEQIGSVLTRNSQVKLTCCGHSEGIYAPTIRYHEGIFYVITTNVSGGGNFIVASKNPAGPWSEPVFLGEEAQGIDPSLFFDEDGTCWYVGQRERTGGGAYFGDCEIWVRRMNLPEINRRLFSGSGEVYGLQETRRAEALGKRDTNVCLKAGMKRSKMADDAVQKGSIEEALEADGVFTGSDTVLAYGYARKSVWAEGPHLYRKDGYYYLIHAEMGTEQNHCVVVARSKTVTGPYEYCLANPILTHRHLGKNYPVTCVGHADLVEDSAGNWYLAALGCRPQEGYTLMGRETFLAKVTWEDGWPVVNLGIGHLENVVEIPGLGQLEEVVEIPGNRALETKGKFLKTGKQKEAWVSVDTGCENENDVEESGQALTGRKKIWDFTGKSGCNGEQGIPLPFWTLRNPEKGMFEILWEHGLRLHRNRNTWKEKAAPSCLMIRQQHHRFRAETKLRLFEHGEGCVCERGIQAESECMPCEAEGGAGLVYLQSNEAHLRLECFAGDALLEDAGPLMHSESSLCPAGNCKERKAARLGIRLMRCCKGVEQVLAYRNDICNREHEVIVGIQVNGLTAAFEWSVGETWNRLAENVDLRFMSTESAGGFVGCTIGMYACSGGVAAGEKDKIAERIKQEEKTGGYVDFRYFMYAAFTKK